MASNTLLTVADGVGGWAMQGVDSGLFSKQLVASIKKIHDKDPWKSLKSVLAESVIMNENQGSSTVIIVKFNDDNPTIIQTCNLGDSGCLVMRRGENGKFYTVHRSAEQQIEFNYPY